MVRPFPISVDFAEVHAVEPACRLRQRGRTRSTCWRTWCRGDLPGRRRRPRGLHQGNSGALPGNRALLEKYPVYLKTVYLRADRRAQPHAHQALSRFSQAEVEAEAERINGASRPTTGAHRLSLNRQHSHQEIETYYRAADLCLVTSLHDGMNLVAKEFVAVAARRRRSADPEPLYRRSPRTARTR